MTGRRLGWAMALGGVLLVSTDALWVRWSEVGGWEASLIASLFALPAYLIVGRLVDGTGPVAAFRVAPRPMLLIALLAATSQISFITALTRTSVANVAIMVGAVPITASVAAWFVVREKPSRHVVTSVLVVFVGILIVVGGSIGEPSLDGDLLALLAITAFSTNIALWRRLPDASRFAALAASAVIVVAVSLVFASPFGHPTRTYLALGAMGLVFNTAGRLLHTTATKHAPAAEIALFTPAETIVAAVLGWIAFNEVPPGATWIGGALILAAVLYGTILTTTPD